MTTWTFLIFLALSMKVKWDGKVITLNCNIHKILCEFVWNPRFQLRTLELVGWRKRTTFYQIFTRYNWKRGQCRISYFHIYCHCEMFQFVVVIKVNICRLDRDKIWHRKVGGNQTEYLHLVCLAGRVDYNKHQWGLKNSPKIAEPSWMWVPAERSSTLFLSLTA